MIVAGWILSSFALAGWSAQDPTPRLIELARDDDVDGIRAALASDADVDVRFQGRTPLMWAAMSGSMGALDVLLAAGADVDAVSSRGTSVLGHAVLGCEVETLRRLLEEGVGPHPEELSELVASAIECPYDGVFSQVLPFVRREAFGADGARHLLHLAAWYGNGAAAEALLARGWSTDERDDVGCTPLHAACAAGQERMALLLLERGASVEARDELGRTPIHVAAEQGHAHVLVRLQGRARVPERVFRSADYLGRTAVHRAAALGHAEALAVLLPRWRPEDLNRDTGASATPLAFAARSGSLTCYELLRSHGAREHFEEPSGIDPAEWARLRRGELSASDVTPMHRPPYPPEPPLLIDYEATHGYNGPGPPVVPLDGFVVRRVRVGCDGIVLACRTMPDGSQRAIAGRLPLERLGLYYDQIVGTGLFRLPQREHGGGGHMGASRDLLTVLIDETPVRRTGSGLAEARWWRWSASCGEAARRNMWKEVGDLLACLVNDAAAMPVDVEPDEHELCR